MWRRRRCALVLLLGSVATLAITAAYEASNHAAAEASFRDLADRATAHVDDRMHLYEYGLRGARGAVLTAGPDAISRAQFRVYERSRNLAAEFPGARGIGFIRRVPVGREDAFVEAARRDGAPAFHIRTLTPHEHERFVIQFIEPVDRNEAAIGLDIASEASRRTAALRALRTGEATLTAPITLVQATGHRLRAFLFLLPVYEGGITPASESARLASSPGWVYSPLVIDEVLADLDLHDGRIALRLRDASEAEPFFESPRPGPRADPGLVRRAHLSLYGRTWEVEVWATPTFVAELRQVPPQLVAVLGACITLLLTALTYVLSQHQERGLELLAEQARRAEIVRTSNDAVIVTTLDGVVTDWNEGATRLFGYPPSEALGRAITTLIVPDQAREERARQWKRVLRGERVIDLETTRRASDGTPREVSITLSPVLDGHGVCVGVALQMRDVAHLRRAAREVTELNASLERQVLERTKMHEAARRDLETLLDAVPSAIGYWGADLTNRVANRPHAEFHGVEASQVIGRHMRDVIGAEAFERDRAHFEAVLRGEATRFPRSSRRADGTDRHTLVYLVPDLTDGQVRGFYAIEHDVTDLTVTRIERAAALRENEALLRTLHHHNLVSITDRAGHILEVNDTFCSRSGYARDELLGQTHRIINSAVHPPAFWKQMWATVASGRTWRGEVCNRAKDGSLYWVDSTITPLLDEAGRVARYISVRTDITAAKHTEEQLRASEAFLDRASRVAGVGAWQVDLGTEEVWWSQELHRIHEVEPGYRPSLESALSFYADASRPVIAAAVTEAMRSGSGWDLELMLVTAKGRTLWVRTVGEVQSVEGRAMQLVGGLQDITARKRAELALQATNERFALASGAAGIGVWELDPAAGSLTWDDQMYALYGRSRFGPQEPYAIWGESVHPDDRARIEDELRAAIGGERAFGTEFRIVWPSGEVRHIHATAQVQRDEAGRPRRVIGTSVDITASKQADLELRETWSLLRAVLDAASEVSIIATDPELTIKVFNAGAERLLGYRADDVVAKTTPILIHDAEEVAARAEELSLALGRPVVGGEVFIEPSTLRQPREWTYVRKDGSRVAVSLVVTAMTRDDGEIFGYLGIAHDVTQQKAIESSLRRAARAAESASLAKSQFLANMSHEIRTPLNAVIGLTHILRQTRLTADQEAYLSKLTVAGSGLRALIDDILDLSKIEAGELRIEEAAFDLRELVRDLDDVMRVNSDAKGIQLGTVWCDPPPRVLVGDAHRLRQVLANLLSNAIKFTEHGGVQLRIERAGASRHGDGHERLRFTVRDSGIGIPPEHQARLFEPFAQADSSTTRRFGGTGLGLSIVRRLALLMGGEVGLSSAPGLGSAFWVELDLEIGNDADLALPHTGPGPTRQLVGVRVLVVDDSEVNRDVASRTLELQGAVVSAACDGREAVDLLSRTPAAFDLVLMDVQMPVMDGPEATRRIRSELGLTLPILALSAGALDSEHQLALAAGMNGFVSKPFDPAVLVDRIDRLVRRGRTAPIETAPSPRTGEASWPPLPGVDTTAAAGRLGGDRARYQSLLQAFCVSLRDLDLTRDPSLDEKASTAKRAAQAHKLRGSAGLLGVEGIERASKALEVACGTEDGHGVDEASRALRDAIRTFLEGVTGAPGWELVPASISGPASPAPADAVRRIDALVQALRAHRLDAIAAFRALSPFVREQLDAGAFDALERDVTALEFERAARTLARLGTPAPNGPRRLRTPSTPLAT